MQGKRPAYIIAEVEVTDPAVFQDYVATAGPTLAAYNARLIVRGEAGEPHGAELAEFQRSGVAEEAGAQDLDHYGATPQRCRGTIGVTTASRTRRSFLR